MNNKGGNLMGFLFRRKFTYIDTFFMLFIYRAVQHGDNWQALALLVVGALTSALGEMFYG